MLSRAKPAVGGDLLHTDKIKKKGRKIPKLEELLSQRDFTGAITLLEVMFKEGCFLGGEYQNIDECLGEFWLLCCWNRWVHSGASCKSSQAQTADSKLIISLIKDELKRLTL